MDQNQSYAQAVQQIDVMRELNEIAIRHKFATKCNDKCPAAKAMDVGCRGAKPVNEMGGVFQWSDLSEPN